MDGQSRADAVPVPAYKSVGEAARALVCLHGIGGSQNAFDDQAEAVTGAGWRLIAWDMPGYGASPLPAGYSFETLARSVVALLDDAGLDRAVLLGHSMGGMVAQETAARFPDRVSGLVLFATTPAFGGRDDKFKNEFLAHRLKPLNEGKTPADIAPNLVGGMFSEATPETVKAKAVESMAAITSDSYRAALECIVTFNRAEDLARIACPTLVLAAEKDTLSPPKTMGRMAERIPAACFVTLDGVGHLANFEDPPRFNAALTDFLATLD